MSEKEYLKLILVLLKTTLIATCFMGGLLIGLVKNMPNKITQECVCYGESTIEEETMLIPYVEEEIIVEEVKKPVTITNYYVGDSTGSTNKLGNGYVISEHCDFNNDNGWCKIGNYYAIATATHEGLKSHYGVLNKYNEQNIDIDYFHYGDTLKMEVNDIVYDFIVVDTCGMSFELWEVDNYTQRYDILIKDKTYAFGKGVAYLYE